MTSPVETQYRIRFGLFDGQQRVHGMDLVPAGVQRRVQWDGHHGYLTVSLWEGYSDLGSVTKIIAVALWANNRRANEVLVLSADLVGVRRDGVAIA